MTRFISPKIRYRALGFAAVLLATAIAPFNPAFNANARGMDTINACRNETLLLPTHPDLGALRMLYQNYLSPSLSLSALDLGVNQLDFARMLEQFSRRIEQQPDNSKPLTAADQSTLDGLRLKYRDAIAQLGRQSADERIEPQRQVKNRGAFSGLGQLRGPVLAPSPIAPASVARPKAASPLQSPAPLSTADAPASPRILKQPVPPNISRPSPEPSHPGFNTEDYARITDNPFFVPTQSPLSTFSVDVDTASYSNIRRFLKRGQLPPKDAVRIEEMINYFSYDYDEPRKDQPFSINTEVAQAPWNPDHKLVQIGLKGRELKTPQPSNLVFLVDVSGSMRSPHKLQLLRRSLCMLVREMKSDDRVTLVTYAGRAGLVLPPTSGQEKKKILQAIDELEAGGSTAGAAGINLAYDMAKKHFLKDGNNRVILATDGDFNVGLSSHGELERLIEEKRKQGIYLSVLGFGTGNYKDSKMETLANKGNGNYAYIDTLAEARKVLVEDMTSTLFTIAKDVKIQVEFNPQKVQAYRLIGYENRLLRDQDFNDDQKDAGEIGAGHTVTALYEVIPPGITPSFDLPEIDDLKYQVPSKDSASANSDELMQVKLRYKQPNDTKSQLISQSIQDRLNPKAPSQDMQFASTVAMFGMILRDSTFKGESDLRSVSERLTQMKNPDPYQSELQTLVNQVALIQKQMK